MVYKQLLRNPNALLYTQTEKMGILTGQELNDGCEDKSLPLLQTEKLKDKDEEAHTTQDSGQYHSGLHSLKISC